MQEILQFVAAGGSLTAGLLIYYVIKIEPRLRSLEASILQGQQVDLMKLTRDLSHSPELAGRAANLLKETEIKLASLQ